MILLSITRFAITKVVLERDKKRGSSILLLRIKLLIKIIYFHIDPIDETKDKDSDTKHRTNAGPSVRFFARPAKLIKVFVVLLRTFVKSIRIRDQRRLLVKSN